MTNFYYSGHLRENERFLQRRIWPYGINYDDSSITHCDFCGDIYDRIELDYVVPTYDNNEDPGKVAWTIKLCGPCLNVIIKDHEIRNFKRSGKYNEQVEYWERLNEEVRKLNKF